LFDKYLLLAAMVSLPWPDLLILVVLLVLVVLVVVVALEVLVELVLCFVELLAYLITCRPWYQGTGSALAAAASLGCALACASMAAKLQID
jgi:hypothetical protein